MRKSLHQTAYYGLFEHPEGFWVLERTDHYADDLDAIDQAHKAVWAAMKSEVAQRVLVVDLRRIRGRNDAAFEKSLVNFRVRVSRQPKHVIILVETHLGAMHVARLARNDGANVEVFVDEERALAAAAC